MVYLIKLLLTLAPAAVTSIPIWEVGRFQGKVPDLNSSSITPKLFYESQQFLPFVVRGYQENLDQLAQQDGFSGDSIDWLAGKIGPDARMTSIEGELQETRMAPTIRRLKFKYFFEKFRELDAYIVTQAPGTVREYLRLLPMFSGSSNTRQMQTPMMWISGGVKQSKSVIHSDSYHNQHCVLKGSKKFMLIPHQAFIETPEYGWVTVDNEDGSRKSGFEDAYGEFAGLIDYNDVDIDAFPKWKDVPWYLAELNDGDCVYMPIGWYHYVESGAEPTVTWHQWFRPPSYTGDDAVTKQIFTDQCFFRRDDQLKGFPDEGRWPEDQLSLCIDSARIN